MATFGEDSDEALMDQVAKGDAGAYRALVRGHADRFLSLAERILMDRAEAEDVVQEAFTKLWTDAYRFDSSKARFTTWFYRVVANRCLDRKRKVRPSALPETYDAADNAPNAEERLQESHRGRAVHAALADLPERQRLAVTLCYLEGMSNAEAAAVIGLSVKGLESLLSRARSALRTALGPDKAALLGGDAKESGG